MIPKKRLVNFHVCILINPTIWNLWHFHKIWPGAPGFLRHIQTVDGSEILPTREEVVDPAIFMEMISAPSTVSFGMQNLFQNPICGK